MRCRQISLFTLATLLTVAGSGLFNPVCAGSLTFEIIADTSGLAPGPGGYVDMVVSPATPPGSPSVSVQIDNFTTDGIVSPGGVLGTPIGTASGDLTAPGGVTENNTAYSELTQNFAVGSFFDVFVTISGSEVGAGASGTFSGTEFFFTIYDSGVGSVGATFVVNPSGTVDGAVVPLPSGPQVTVTSVPEPSSAALLSLGLGAVTVASRHRRRRRRVIDRFRRQESAMNKGEDDSSVIRQVLPQ